MDFNPASERQIFLNDKNNVVPQEEATKLIVHHLDKRKRRIGETQISLEKK